MSEWFAAHEHWLPWIQAFAIVSFVGSLALLPWLVARIPADYFARPEPQVRAASRDRHPLLVPALWVVRNLTASVLFVAGVAMLLLPGQGLLTIAISLVVADFPGKRRVELWLVSRRGLLRSLNWIRARRGQPPLELGAGTLHAPGSPGRPDQPTD